VTPDIVEVWLIRSDLPDPVLADLETLLDDTERQRAGALLDLADRGRFVAAHGAARLLIGRRLGVPPALLSWRYGPHGKPELAPPWTGAHVSLSRSGGLAALAMTDERRVGIDLQRLLPGVDVTRMAQRFYPPGEARFVVAGRTEADRMSRFVRLWTIKEASVKVDGGRLVPGLRRPADGTDHLTPCLIRDVPAPPGCYAAVALAGVAPYRVVRLWWPGYGADVRAEVRGGQVA
jgi:4'-phosphopantetheinyl transferase